jgi:murein DD-endopeptidase
MKRLWPVAVIVAALSAQTSLAQTADSSLPIEIAVPSAPIPVRGAGASHLFYELHLTNFRTVPLELRRVEVHAGDGRSLESYGAPEISDRLIRPGAQPISRASGCWAGASARS